MTKRTLIVVAFTSALSLIAGFANAASEPETVYGSQLMTQQERMVYRNKMRAAKTVEAREQIRTEHHQRMQERAKSQGLSLPDQPPAVGGGMGPGGGAGLGGGMGQGGGRGR